MITVDELKEKFCVREDQELAPIFGRKKGAVAVWRREGVPAAIELKAGELLAAKADLLKGIAETGGMDRVADISEADYLQELVKNDLYKIAGKILLSWPPAKLAQNIAEWTEEMNKNKRD